MSKPIPQRPPDPPMGYYPKKLTHIQWFKHFERKRILIKQYQVFSFFWRVELTFWHIKDYYIKK